MTAARKYSYGHIPDHDHVVANDHVVRPLIAMPGLAGAAPREMTVSLEALLRQIDGVPDQGATSSCVGNGTSTAILLRAHVCGQKIVRPSRKALYDFGRLLDTPDKPLVDEGSRPSAVFNAARDFGLVAEERWPLTDGNINEDPPEDVFKNAIDAKLAEHYRILPGVGCSALVRQALTRGCPVTFAMPVDQAYEDYDGSGVYGGLQGPSLGGHDQCVIGFTPSGLVVCNSWGEGWGKRGIAIISDAWFDSGQVTDLLVPTLVPNGVA